MNSPPYCKKTSRGILRPLNADCLVETVFKGAKIPREVFLQ